MEQVHEMRRIQFYGSPAEKRQLSQKVLEEKEFLSGLKTQRLVEEKKRDDFETKRCNEMFMEQCRRAKE
eukprot:CAMPEP_0202962768 /NCGR_PEP_ID=MMETSP1396-20130829/6830_1 /ASSEMBLY_ACC=CAM_ASM_000872 /TAXON_ID= /ORGANISM="Pseudokeronopsis sp., Strain Brazil" /LENGTH=68 /DNA_ID=CAMNT_0049683527 /DNA_START=138 /DNA_END=344 /DNA_ORIENTATION=-